MASEFEQRGRSGRGADSDLVLAPGEYSFIQDGTKGHVSVYVGPMKTTISQTDVPVIWDPGKRRYEEQDNPVVHSFPSAPEGSYMVLQNPAPSTRDDKAPMKGTSSQFIELLMGRKVNIPGPATFPLWPGQSADVIEGHRLRSNQYLLVRIYNDEEAQKNWNKAVVKPNLDVVPQHTQHDEDEETETPEDTTQVVAAPEVLTMGQLLIVKGIDVSFYIPPTGVEVVAEQSGKFVRDAVTLERLEYCILLDESGEKRYVVGPDVVFPRPTETFVTEDNARKFRAIELNEIQGLYVKVIADYDEDGRHYKAGDELFITGREQAIYYPRPEHSIIRYGDQTKHYAVAIPAGEARYVLDRMSGDVKLGRGPKMFLADPRKEVLVRRILSPDESTLWFPGNATAQRVNELLRKAAASQETNFVTSRQALQFAESAETQMTRSFAEGAASFQRGTGFTEPRTITLDSKYEGSVRIEVWPGYAVLVVSKTGKRRAVIGPEVTHLEYDESLLPFELSTGKPKTTDHLVKSVYLKVRNNTVSDIVSAETKDLCQVKVKLSYRVNFTGDDPEKWFEVDNYVKFLTDHLRSMLRHAVKQHGIEEFYANATSIIRDTVLGTSPQQGEGRPGRSFEENGMHVYDVEVLDVTIENTTIATLLVSSQQEAIQIGLKTAALDRQRDFVEKQETANRSMASAHAETKAHEHSIAMEKVEREHLFDLETISNRAAIEIMEIKHRLEQQAELSEISKAELERGKASLDQAFDDFSRRLKAESDAVKDQVGSVSDKLAEGLVLSSRAGLAMQLSKDLAPLVTLGGGNVEEVFNGFVKGTFLQNLLHDTRSWRPSAGAVSASASAD